MTALAWLIPAALFLGGLGLVAFLWALRSGQFEDLEGASYRALEDEPPEVRAELRHTNRVTSALDPKRRTSSGAANARPR